MTPTVYLDTNIFIEGATRQEHRALKDLAMRGDIRLFIGPEVSREIRDKISNLRDRKHEILMAEEKYTPRESAELRKVIDDQIESNEKQLRRELLFWKDAKPERPKNTFEGIMTTIMAKGLDFAYTFDIKGEIALVVSLQRDFNIKPTDACHLMQAHSARLDYFLSWDRKQLVNRAKRVRWLIPRVMTPSAFLKVT